MRAIAVARKEVADAIRSRVLRAIVAVVAVVNTLVVAVTLLVPDGPSVYSAIGGMAQIAGVLVPIVALVAAYLSIAGERESGSIKVLLGLPPTRSAVLAGKFLGRSAVVIVGILAGYAVAALVAVAAFGSVPAVAFAGATLLAAVLGVIFVGIAIGISGATATRSRAMTVSIATYLLLTLFWDAVPELAAMALGTSGGSAGTVPAWYLLLRVLSPTGAFNALVVELLGVSTGTPGIAATVAGPVPFYLQPVALAAVLVAWTAVPLAYGHRAFRRADLS
ncbi:MAG: ABC transporter permease subunit [Halanaeroarchaeum sp.]